MKISLSWNTYRISTYFETLLFELENQNFIISLPFITEKLNEKKHLKYHTDLIMEFSRNSKVYQKT